MHTWLRSSLREPPGGSVLLPMSRHSRSTRKGVRRESAGSTRKFQKKSHWYGGRRAVIYYRQVSLAHGASHRLLLVEGSFTFTSGV